MIYLERLFTRFEPASTLTNRAKSFGPAISKAGSVELSLLASSKVEARSTPSRSSTSRLPLPTSGEGQRQGPSDEIEKSFGVTGSAVYRSTIEFGAHAVHRGDLHDQVGHSGAVPELVVVPDVEHAAVPVHDRRGGVDDAREARADEVARRDLGRAREVDLLGQARVQRRVAQALVEFLDRRLPLESRAAWSPQR